MIKTMRKHAKYFYVLFFIVILTFIFWGVGPLDKPTVVAVAEIGKEKITIEEYWRTYERVKDFYRQIYKGQFDQAMEERLKLKEVVLNGLIEERILLISANEMGIVVTDQELQDTITSDPRFMRDGVFKKDVYLKTLQLNRITPEIFENSVRQQLIVQKMRMLIGSTVDISTHDIGHPLKDDRRFNEVKQILLSQKKEKAIKSYIESMKLKLNVKINKDLIT
ncbi:MAG: SurA N-terminal domain-containing protein [Thermodesulfovibrionales bacterium]|nr:SurA N-terminal domain-containing protein [Thermodesulfovibrionales bacterium]